MVQMNLVYSVIPYLWIVTCKVVHATKMAGSSSDDWIYYHLDYNLS
jgi:hypothetical protein